MKKWQIAVIAFLACFLGCCICGFGILILVDTISIPAVPTNYTFPNNIDPRTTTSIGPSATIKEMPTLTSFSPTFTTQPQNPSPLPYDPRTATIQALLTQAASAQTNAANTISSPKPSNTNIPSVPQPTLTSTQEPPSCSCSGDLYNCSESDFNSVREAQDCFDYCISIGAGDVHDLDRDNDGIVCEWGLSSG